MDTFTCWWQAWGWRSRDSRSPKLTHRIMHKFCEAVSRIESTSKYNVWYCTTKRSERRRMTSQLNPRCSDDSRVEDDDTSGGSLILTQSKMSTPWSLIHSNLCIAIVLFVTLVPQNHAIFLCFHRHYYFPSASLFCTISRILILV